MQEHTNTAVRGLLGVASTSGGIIISNLPAVEAWLRITSLCVGIAVGVLTAISIVRKMLRKKN
jgi:hypothetical protein